MLVRAQSGSEQSDSLMTYELSGVVVGTRGAAERRHEALSKVSLSDVVQENAFSAADIVRLIPAAYLQTNSRGESLVYLRNAGERQVATFLDGAILNIPWDNRIDLSMIPSSLIGAMEVTRGAPSVVYGTNVIGGAVNIRSRSLERVGSHLEIQGSFGTNRAGSSGGMYMQKGARNSVLLVGNYVTTDGISLPTGANIPFSQSGNSIRTNTDRQRVNAYLRFTRSISERTTLAISFLHVDGSKGIAPESHLDPDFEKVRFWRYPVWRNTMLIINAVSALGRNTSLRTTAWLGKFTQEIDEYESVLYRNRSETENGRDQSAGIRMASFSEFPAGSLRFAVNYSTSRHRETITDQTRANPDDHSETRFYRQHLYSVGMEYRHSVSSTTSLLAGVSFDGAITPETGDKPALSGMQDFGLNASLVTELGKDVVLRSSFGRKVRFPTMRELFGDALKTFQINPGLKPESAFLGDVEVEINSSLASGGVAFFIARTFDTIERINVVVDGERNRMRINLDGSRVWGVELRGTAKIAEMLTADGHLTFSKPIAFTDQGRWHLNEKPELLSALSLHARSRWGGSVRITSIITGKAYSLQPDNSQSRLPESLVLNIRGAVRKYFTTHRIFVEAFAAVKNVTDELTLPQLGLPGPGREIHIGLSLSQ